jgi:L-lactate dehydrogenase complex protein LldF
MWSFVARHPALYAFSARWAARLLRGMGGPGGLIHALPLAGGWTDERDMPAPAGRTFRDLYRQRRKVEKT